MRASILSATLGLAASTVSALPSTPRAAQAPALPIEEFVNTRKFVTPLTLDQALSGVLNITTTNTDEPQPESEPEFGIFAADNVAAAGTCSSLNTRIEWDSYSNSDRQAFINAIKCLQGRPPNGQFAASQSRYEDFVALHQTLTPNVHGNAKFLLWHRYYLWTFESVLRSDCGFDRAFPWWDETKYAGRFWASSVFSSDWFGSVTTNGNCVTDGQFANLAINVGPGTGNQYHCLARNNDDSKTANSNQQIVDACNSRTDYADMAACAEGGAHAWGHNGIGAVMQDVYASPSDPTFWLHHAFIDRNFRIWQNADSSRISNIDGVDTSGRPLTLDTTVNVYDFRPTVAIRDLLDTTNDKLCYRYNY